MKVNMNAIIKIPRVPNFIREDGGDGNFSVADFTDEQLREIGSAWTDDLIENAKRKRITSEALARGKFNE